MCVAELADATLQYARGDVVDATEVQSNNPVGITCLKIALGIMHYLGPYIPILRTDNEGN